MTTWHEYYSEYGHAPEWNKFITIRQQNGKVITGEKPFDYAGDIKKNYEANNHDYNDVYER